MDGGLSFRISPQFGKFGSNSLGSVLTAIQEPAVSPTVVDLS